MQYPGARARVLKHLEVIALAPGRVLVVVITTDGEVGERSLTLHVPLDDAQLREVREHLRHHCGGATSGTAQSCVDEATASARPELAGTVAAIGAALTDVLSGQSESKIVVAGAANLARGALDFRDIAPVLDALEEQVVLLKLLGAAAADLPGDVAVRIGEENPYGPLRTTSVVASSYGPSDSPAHLGIVGPTRMDYPSTMAIVRAVARYVGQFLTEG